MKLLRFLNNKYYFGVLLGKCSGITNQIIYSNSNGNHNGNWKVKSRENCELEESSSVLVEIIYTQLKGEKKHGP